MVYEKYCGLDCTASLNLVGVLPGCLCECLAYVACQEKKHSEMRLYFKRGCSSSPLGIVV